MSTQKQSPSKLYVVLANEVTNAFIKEVQEEFGYRCWCTGGSMPYDIEEIEVDFSAYRKATINEARELEIMLVEKFLQIINSNEKIRPYLREFPFTSARIHVSIAFNDKNNQRQIKNSIYRVSLIKNKLFYKVYDPKTEKPIDIAEESYDDALKIVQDKLSSEISTT